MDTEFIVQMLQLKHGADESAIRVPGTINALGTLAKAGILAPEDAEFLHRAYGLQRSVEARIRLMDAAGRHEFPSERLEVAKLAYLMGYTEPEQLAKEVSDTSRNVRSTFQRIFS
jgi:[glutamine synthetase] adenylyltransferase / [glutamine synthetase]-adenylyl-L-tyrosine phosphorylase